MKIAILTSGILPVPAVQGGAVENLIDFYLEYNDRHRLHDITVYSMADKAVKGHSALKATHNHYHYIDTNSLFAKIRKYRLRKLPGYYNYTIEYYLNEALRRLKKKEYDVIIVENRPGFVLKFGGSIDGKCILHLHNDFLNTETKLAEAIYCSYDSVISVSNYITNRVKAICPESNNCKTVHNAIDVTHFLEATPLERKAIGLDKNDFVIVYSGRLKKEKGILELVQAMKQIHGIPNLRLLVIGASFYGANQTPSRFVSDLVEAVRQVRDKVVFTGFVNYAEIPSYLKCADLAVVPSMWEEPFGLTVVEAMAAGLPLITTRSGGIPEICEGVATIVERDGIVNHLKDAIIDLYQHPEKRKAMSEASLERSKQFDKETYARNFFAALETLESS